MHFGYIDPGSGSLFIQAVIGVIISGAFIFRNGFSRLKHKVVQLFKPKNDSETK